MARWQDGDFRWQVKVAVSYTVSRALVLQTKLAELCTSVFERTLNILSTD